MLVAGLVLGCAPAPPEEREIEMLGGSPGVDMLLSTSFSDIVNKNHPYIKMSVVETVDASTHPLMAEERDPNQVIYEMNSNDYISARLGMDPWPKQYTDIKWIAGWMPGVVGFITIDPNINSLADCAGKTIGIMPGPDVGTNLVVVETLKELGIYDQVTLKRLGFDEMHWALRDGIVDVIHLLSIGRWDEPLMGQPMLEEVLAAKDGKIYGVDWPHDVLRKVYAKIGFSRGLAVAVPGSLPKEDRPFELTTLVLGLACQADADKELIYEITKTQTENAAKYQEYFFPLFQMTSETMVEFMPVDSEDEVHPGALKYYKEVGYWPDLWENGLWLQAK